ncbi:MAG: BON domain-containing protein [Elusimicrobiota bacterium]
MKRTGATAAKAAAFLAFLAWAGARGRAADPPPPTDAEITRAVKEELKSHSAFLPRDLSVKTDDGVVTLSGAVGNLPDRTLARDLAESVRGVRAVVNAIEVRTARRPDADILKDVREALRYDPAVDPDDLRVSIRSGAVTLSGTVQSWAEQELAMTAARQVRGVRDVRDEINIVYKAPRADEEIRADVEGRWRADIWLADDPLSARVRDGRVTLSGSVDSAAEKTMAVDSAWVLGAASVDAAALNVRWEPRSEPASRTDAQIRDAVQDAFLRDPRVLSFNPRVAVNDGVVTLTGTVNNLKAKNAAGEDAMNTAGVRRVINGLQVNPSRPPADTAVARGVRDALLRDPYTDSHEINVAAAGGVVTLSGRVDALYEKLHAADVASRGLGVVAVVNNLAVETFARPDDAAIRKNIESQLFWSPFVDADQVDVAVSEGVATLTGEVDSWGERGAAVDNAYEGGAWDVVSRLKVDGLSVF